MPNRPNIPAGVSQAVLIESGHRCAVCGVPCPLERAHIIPWCKSRSHRFEDLICLCANCHERADKEHWGKSTLREYKSRPWVDRQNNPPENLSRRPQVDPEAAVAHFEALVDGDWKEADDRFWQEMRELEDELAKTGRSGGSAHSLGRRRLGERDMKRRADLLIRRAEEVLGAAGGSSSGALGETAKRVALSRLALHYDEIEEKLDDSNNVGRGAPFGRPDLGKDRGLAALEAEFFVLLGGAGESSETVEGDDSGTPQGQPGRSG